MRRVIKIVVISIFAAGMAGSASAASPSTSKFAPENGPEETVYRPECRIVQTDGTWLPSRRIECDW